jgi:hypothetical protein
MTNVADKANAILSTLPSTEDRDRMDSYTARLFDMIESAACDLSNYMSEGPSTDNVGSEIDRGAWNAESSGIPNNVSDAAWKESVAYD